MDNESRMARLEERLTWLQHNAVEQDKAINAQSREIKKIAEALALLKKQIFDSLETDSETQDERPPHY